MLVCTLEKYVTLFIVLVLLDYFHILEIEESWKYRHHKNFAFLVKFWRELRWILCLVQALIFFFLIRANVLWALLCNCTCSCIVLSLFDLFMHSAFFVWFASVNMVLRCRSWNSQMMKHNKKSINSMKIN